ncbi:MAG: hypothetical protein NTV86_03805 [Planctomycetota bacterium]|nr:hypothetical protein [Planctomycetota bacterium]
MTLKFDRAMFLGLAVGTVVPLAVILAILHFRGKQDPAAQLVLKAKRVELVERMRVALASASEAEKSAVMAITDEDSLAYASQASAATATVEQGRRELESLLEPGGTQKEKETLAQFSRAFLDFQRIDKELLILAVRNTNIKAYSLAFGPAAATIKEMDGSLARVVAAHGNSTSADDLKVMRLTDGARLAALRLLALLPPHIAEESDQKMDEMEAVMTKEDQMVRQNLESLAAIPGLSGNADLTTAAARYAQFAELRAQILKLSRENTNVRSLTISLSQKRKVMLICQDALAGLEQLIQEEPVAGLPQHAPVSPR